MYWDNENYAEVKWLIFDILSHELKKNDSKITVHDLCIAIDKLFDDILKKST